MKKIKLKEIDTGAPKKLNKEKIKKETIKLKEKMDDLQNLLYAESKHGLLIVLQGMDASGKDGVLRRVFNTVNPLGCWVTAFKAPTEGELMHDFLWRVHIHTPPKGMIHVFNRSHYEDVLIQKVHKWVDDKIITKRYEHINNFERLLTESGTVVLKFYLHISKEEQLRRLEERMTDKTKMWKYNEGDLKESEFWDDYMKAYEDAFENCSVGAGWNIVPSDHNWYKEYFIAQKIVDTLESLKMKFPGFKPPTPINYNKV